MGMMRRFYFDRAIDRRGTNALALEGYAEYLFGDSPPAATPKELLPMWVADMQFAAPPPVVEAITTRLAHPIFGYTGHFDDVLFDAFNSWCGTRYGWSVNREHLQLSLGVIPALYTLVDLVCRPGDRVVTLSPAYGYFRKATNRNDIQLITSPLVMDDWYPRIDFDDLAAKVRDPRARLFFLCHPHNPTGRAWSADELMRIADLCAENGVLIVSDEVHCDLLRRGGVHVPLAKLRPHDTNIVTCMAPSKTFNLAGLMTAMIIIPDGSLRSAWREAHYPFVNPLGLAAAIGAFDGGASWLEQLRDYLDDNFAALQDLLKTKLPLARFRIPEATYLAWIDVSAYFPTEVNLTSYFLETCGVVLEGGEMFIDNGSGAIRLNLACPQNQLIAAAGKIIEAIHLSA
ncbi:MAG: PatB family C-S lyase [Sphingomonadales bacterium]|nr:PatB family C-S lyase [Sphingomonadales bacterium]